MEINIRKETLADYRIVEELTQEAFWGSMEHPTCYILQLAEMGVRTPVCSLIRTKDGISLYRVESEGKKLILKVFERGEDAREIDNYLMLSKLKIQTLPLLGYTKNAILLPDVE